MEVQNKEVRLKMREFCIDARVSSARIYKFPLELQPRSSYVGRARIITESPGDWLRRIANAQSATPTDSPLGAYP